MKKKEIQISNKLIDTLKQKSLVNRHLIMDMLTRAGSSHLGCSFSVIDILTTLYHSFLNTDLIEQQSPQRDFFILSKGHSASALYATLATEKFFDKELLKNYHKSGSPFTGHPMRGSLPGVEASTGSLGHGLSIGVGLAIAAKNDTTNNHIYVLVGDGECQEGSIWEAIILASRFKLNNLTIIVDYNNLQGLDKSDDLMPGTLEEKFKAFHCIVHHANGHNFEELIATLNNCSKTSHPDVIIARTTKGKGLASIENKLEWHYRSFRTEEEYNTAKQEVTSS